MTRPLVFAIAMLLAAAAAGAATLDLPVRLPADNPAPPFYRGDVLVLRLAPRAARAAQPFAAGPTRADSRARLGVPAVDALASSLGIAAFEPEFAGELPPPADDPGAPDLTAFHVVHLPPGLSLESALEQFAALPEVLSAEPVAVLPVSTAPPNDSLWHRQTWMKDTGLPRHDDRILDAWNTQQGDTSIVVGVLDTGILAWHPDLGGTTAGERGNLFVNWSEAGGLAGFDDDANGFIDDVSGWDFVDSVAVATGEDGRGKDNDPSDFVGHGTAVAGIIGALVNNSTGMAGMVPRVRLMPLRCAYAFPSATRPSA
ncbi:MAG: S8 family serine peptidase, partial [Candidatus Eisenbacteria bacterium]|nr:S8 family serine peptidase [Candidatus Eisenbacteria bacterium]